MTIVVSYLSVKDSAATPSAGFYAQYSTDAGNNTGWVIFSGSYLQTLAPSLYSNSNAFYGASVKYKVTPGLFINGNELFTPSVIYRLNPGNFINQNLFYGANVSRGFNPPNGRDYTANYDKKSLTAFYQQRNYTAKQ